MVFRKSRGWNRYEWMVLDPTFNEFASLSADKQKSRLLLAAR